MAAVLMFVGIGLIGVLTATVASYFVTQNADEDKADLVERLDRIESMLVELTGHQIDVPEGTISNQVTTAVDGLVGPQH